MHPFLIDTKKLRVVLLKPVCILVVCQVGSYVCGKIKTIWKEILSESITYWAALPDVIHCR